MLPPDQFCSSLFLSGLSPSLFSFPILKLKCSGTVVLQCQTGIELLTSLAGQAIEDGCSSCGQQVPDIVLGEQRATDLTEDVEVASLVSAFGDFGINAHTFVTTFRAVVGGVRLLHLWSKGKEFLADSADV